MLERLVFALVCAAVMSFIMCSDAARASPITTQVDNGVKHNVRRLYTPNSQHRPLFTGLLSTETGLQTGTNSEVETSGNYREALSIIDHQTNPLRFTEGSFGYNQNNPDNRQSRAGMTGRQSGVRPASSIVTSYSQHGGQSFERQQSRVNYHPLSQKVAQSGNSYNSYPVIIRKSSHKEAASPFHQSSSPSQVWGPKDAQKSYNQEKVPRNESPKVAEDKTVWQPSSLFSSQTGRHWSTSLPTPRGHYSGYKETNELAAAGARSTSSRIQSSKFLGFASQTAPHAPSISNSYASVIKSNPSPEKLTSSITGFSQGLDLVGSNETPRHKKVRSYLFKDSQTSFGGHETVKTATGGGPSAFSTTPHKQRPSQDFGRFSSNFKRLQPPQRKDPTKEVQHLSDNANPLYHNANVAHGAQTDSFTKYQRTTADTPAQISVHPAPGTYDTMESFVPTPHAHFQGNYATGSKKSVVSSLVNTTTRGSMHAYKPGRSIKSIYGFRGFENPTWTSILSSSGSNERTNSQRYSFDKGKFKITNIYPSLSPKYSFGQREASTTPERTTTDYSSPSTGTLDTKAMTTPRPFTSGFKEARPLLPESDAGMDSNPDRRQFRNYRRIYGLKGFGSRPLEGAKPLVSEPDKSARVQQGFEGFKLRSSQIWHPKSRWYNKTGETEPGSSHVSTMSQNELSSEDLKPLLKMAGSTESDTRFTPGKYKKSRKIYTSLGFQPVQNRIGNANNKTHWKYKELNPTTASVSHRISSVYLRSAGDLKVESSPKSEPNKTKPVAMKTSLLNSSTSSTVRGKRVKDKKLSESTSLTNDAGNAAIVRLPKRPARVKAVTYADILGSASFSGVRATTQTPITPADKDSFPNATATTKQKEGAAHWTLNSEDAVHSRDNTSKGPEAHAEDEGEDFSSVEGNKLAVRSEDVDSDMKTSDLFLDDEGSGSGGFNIPDVLSTDASKSLEGLSEDLLELDYLRISTGNISFKSMKLSHTEK